MRLISSVLCVLLCFAGSAQATTFNIIYIEPSEGNASAGHFALQLGEAVYHYQYDAGMIRLFKHEAKVFQTEYQNRQNRTLHIASIDVPETTVAVLDAHFKNRLFQQNHYLKQLQGYQQDFNLLKALINTKEKQSLVEDQSLPVLSGAGLFYSEDKYEQSNCETTYASKIVIDEVRRRLRQNYGKDFLAAKLSALNGQLANLYPVFSSNSDDANAYSFAKQYADQLNGVLTLEVLQTVKSLAKTACFQVNAEGKALNSTVIDQLKQYQQRLFATTQSLMRSARSDWAYALFVTMARLITIEQTLQSGKWYFLDDSNDDATTLTQDQLRLYADSMQKERFRDKYVLYDELAQLTRGMTIDEFHYGQLEKQANRYQRWLESDSTGILRYHSQQALPSKSVNLVPYLRTALSKEQLQASLTEVASRLNAILQEDNKRNRYNLLFNNCVTAIFENINEALSKDPPARLAQVLDQKFSFVPYQAFSAVLQHYPVSHLEERKGYRLQQLAKLYQSKAQSSIYAQEFNVFSANLYHYNSDDAWFVFFTDDVVWPRPIFGTFNLAAAASQSLWGMFKVPLDGGNTLKTGLRGVLTSLPELVFLNIRKGSYPYPVERN